MPTPREAVENWWYAAALALIEECIAADNAPPLDTDPDTGADTPDTHEFSDGIRRSDWGV